MAVVSWMIVIAACVKITTAKNNIEKEHCKHIKIYIYVSKRINLRKTITACDGYFIFTIYCVHGKKEKRNTDTHHVKASKSTFSRGR